MNLNKLDIGNELKCTCPVCHGAGINTGIYNQDEYAIICFNCNGRGYNIKTINDNLSLMIDEESGLVYEINSGILCGHINLFKELRIVDNVKYVTYGNGKLFSPKFLEEHKDEFNIITYEDFLNGSYPLPMMEYTCPKQILQNYKEYRFDNDCIGCFSSCPKYGEEECWDKFYGDASTKEEKQMVLKRVK